MVIATGWAYKLTHCKIGADNLESVSPVSAPHSLAASISQLSDVRNLKPVPYQPLESFWKEDSS
jgi:hypothetical protein